MYVLSLAGQLDTPEFASAPSRSIRVRGTSGEAPPIFCCRLGMFLGALSLSEIQCGSSQRHCLKAWNVIYLNCLINGHSAFVERAFREAVCAVRGV